MKITFEFSKCPICFSNNVIPFLNFKKHIYLKCKSCKTLFLSDYKKILETMIKIYKENYHDLRAHTKHYQLIEEAKLKTFNYYLNKLNPPTNEKVILEIGCSSGFFLKQALKNNWKAFGIEISAVACEFAQKIAPEAKIFNIKLEESDFPNQQFDAIVMFDVLEHLAEPHFLLKKLYNWLKPEGELLVLTPDSSCFSIKFLKKYWPHFMLEHFIIYSKKSIKLLFETNFFKVRKIGHAPKYVNLEMLFRHTQTNPNTFGGFFIKFLHKILTPTTLSKLVFKFNIGELYIIGKK